MNRIFTTIRKSSAIASLVLAALSLVTIFTVFAIGELGLNNEIVSAEGPTGDPQGAPGTNGADGPAKVSKLPDSDLSDFWRATSDVAIARGNLDRAQSAFQEALRAQSVVIDRLAKSCGDKNLASASAEQAKVLNIREETPICVPKPPDPKAPETKKPSQ